MQRMLCDCRRVLHAEIIQLKARSGVIRTSEKCKIAELECEVSCLHLDYVLYKIMKIPLTKRNAVLESLQNLRPKTLSWKLKC